VRSSVRPLLRRREGRPDLGAPHAVREARPRRVLYRHAGSSASGPETGLPLCALAGRDGRTLQRRLLPRLDATCLEYDKFNRHQRPTPALAHLCAADLWGNSRSPVSASSIKSVLTGQSSAASVISASVCGRRDLASLPQAAANRCGSVSASTTGRAVPRSTAKCVACLVLPLPDFRKRSASSRALACPAFVVVGMARLPGT